MQNELLIALEGMIEAWEAFVPKGSTVPIEIYDKVTYARKIVSQFKGEEQWGLR